VFRIIAVRVLVLGFVLASLLQPSQAGERKERAGTAMVRAPAVIFAPPSPEEARTVAKELNLSPEQQKQMQGVNERYNREIMSLKQDYENAVRSLMSLIQDPTPNPSVANQRLKEFHSVNKRVLDKEFEYWQEFKTILTPDQNSKFWTLFGRSRLGVGGSAPGRDR
jgi:Spy/CpxP family protein refolding chaperone